ncbi:MAG: hypothetical protein JWL81_974, partial [Verrucomicrobiales bacterium]|nr:hypothetical protein [Verrucomicrobiales bacterium]
MKPYPNSSRGRRGALPLLFLGLLCLSAPAQGIITQSEPDDSIPTAKDTGLTAGTSGIKVAFGHTGDGPYGLPPGDSTGDVDFFKVSAAAGQKIFANINNAGIDPDFDSYLGIYDSAGNLLVEADDKGNTSRGYDRTSVATWTAVTAGDYYVCVSNWIAATSLPNDPFVPGTAPGLPGGKAGPYQLFVGLDVAAPVPQFVGGSTGYPVPAFLPVKAVGTPRYDGVLTLRNISPGTGPSAAYVINSFSITGTHASRFTVSNLVTPVSIPAGGELNVNISFNAAGFSGLAEAVLNLNSNDPFAQNFVLNTYGSPVIGGGKFAITQVKATTGTIGSIAAADDLLNGIIPGTTLTGETPAINYGSGGEGHVGNDFAFLGTPPAIDNFATKITGSFSIRTAGDYTFLGYCDDGQRLIIDGETLYSFEDANTDHFGFKNLTAGLHTFELTHYDGAGGNAAEILISKQPGQFTSYISSTWELLEAFSDDSDGDGMPNAYETSNGTNPDVNDAGVDLDTDGLTNIQEYAAGTKPTVADTDADGYKDGVETKTGIWVSPTNTGSDALVADSDADGLLDGVENLTQATTGPTQPGTDPNKKDTDADGYADLSEITLGTDPKVLASVPTFTLQPTFTETFDAPGFHSTYLFKSFTEPPPFAPGVYDSEIVSHGKVGQLTDTSTGNHNSVYFDFVDTVNAPVVQIAFDFRIATVDTNPADGFGIGLFRRSAYGSNGATAAITAAKAWENPLGAGGYGDALFFGFGIYGTDVIRVTGPAAPTVAAGSLNPSFGLATGLYNRAIITVITNGTGGSMVKLEIIEDSEGVATRRVIFDNVLVPGFTIASEDFRLIAGARTGASVSKVELDNMSVSIPEQPTPSLVLSTTMGSILADIYDGSTSAVNPATLQVTVNGAPLTITPTKTSNITTASYVGAPGVFFTPGLNTAVFTYSSTTGTPYTDTRTFTVDPYLLLPPSLALPSSAGVTAGFNVKTYQVSPIVAGATTPNWLDYAEGLLAGATGSPFVGGNVADLTNATNGIFHTDTINFEQDGLAFGFFSGESMVPGIPGTTFSTDNYAIEALSWVNFPTAGLYRFGVTADDGFRVSV